MTKTNKFNAPEIYNMQTLDDQGDAIMYVAASIVADRMNADHRADFSDWTELDEWELHEQANEIYRSIKPADAAEDACYGDTEVRYTVYDVVVNPLVHIHGWSYDFGRISA